MSSIIMGKQKSWYGWIKRLFITTEPTDKARRNFSKNSQKSRRWEWGFGRLKKKQYHPTITAPTRTTLTEATAEQRKHALTVAIATAAAAEAAVAAAHAAAEVVKITSGSRSYLYLSKGDRSLAAIKIQSAYRAHLARKALRALKGVTRLQAIIRGQAVRRQVSSTLKNFPCYARNREEMLERSSHTGEDRNKGGQIKHFPNQKMLEEQELKLECHSQRTWDCSSHSREDIEATWLRKQEAIAKRERMKQYSFSQRERKIPQMVEESVHNNDYQKESCRTLGQWLHKETGDRDALRKQDPSSNLITMRKELQEEDDGPNYRILIPAGKSFSHGKCSSVGIKGSLPNSPVLATYMALTESSKAKVRSISTPRLRTRFLDTCSNQSEPHNNEDIFSYYGTTTSTNYNGEASQQRCHSTTNNS